MALLTTFTGGLVLAIYYHQSREILFRRIQSQVLSIATTGAAAVNGDLLGQIQTRQDENTSAYARIRKSLRDIRDANRRQDVHVRFVYAMRRIGENPSQWVYVVDAEEDGSSRSHTGDPVNFVSEAGQQALRLDQSYVESSFSRDAFGTWLSANSPIHDTRGRPVGLLGVDIAADEVVAQLRRLLRTGLIATGIGVASSLILAVLIAHLANSPLEKIRAGVQRIGEGDWDTRVEVHSRDEFGAVARAVNEMAVALRDREMLKGALTRYVSRDVAEGVLADRALPSLRGERREITVLIADIRNFTALTESVSPEELVRFLNLFLGRMIDVIFGHRGTLDKFLGDGLLAIFGAPLDDPEHHKMAVQAGIAMVKAMDDLGAEMKERLGIEVRIGVAVHTGHAIVGNIGSDQRMEYTAIGDAVNVTSRIEALNKEYQTNLLATQAVVDAVGNSFGEFREVAEVRLRGVQQPVRVYTIAG